MERSLGGEREGSVNRSVQRVMQSVPFRRYQPSDRVGFEARNLNLYEHRDNAQAQKAVHGILCGVRLIPVAYSGKVASTSVCNSRSASLHGSSGHIPRRGCELTSQHIQTAVRADNGLSLKFAVSVSSSSASRCSATILHSCSSSLALHRAIGKSAAALLSNLDRQSHTWLSRSLSTPFFRARIPRSSMESFSSSLISCARNTTPLSR